MYFSAKAESKENVSFFYRLHCPLKRVGDHPHTVSELNCKRNLDLLSLTWESGRLGGGLVKNCPGICCSQQVKAERYWLYWSKGTLEKAEQRATSVQLVFSFGIDDGMLFGLCINGKQRIIILLMALRSWTDQYPVLFDFFTGRTSVTKASAVYEKGLCIKLLSVDLRPFFAAGFKGYWGNLDNCVVEFVWASIGSPPIIFPVSVEIFTHTVSGTKLW